MAYQPVDLLDLDAQLTDEERQVRDSVRSFVEREALPSVNGHFREGTFPLDLVPGMAALGIFGAPITGYGCAGVGPIAHGLINREVERADSGFRSFASVQSSLAMGAIHLHGSEEQRQHYLPEMAAGRILGAFALTEPNVGSDPAAMELTAQRDGDDWVLNGSKFWISNGSQADVIVVFAQTDPGSRHKGVAAFVVDGDAQGLERQDIPDKMGLTASSPAVPMPANKSSTRAPSNHSCSMPKIDSLTRPSNGRVVSSSGTVTSTRERNSPAMIFTIEGWVSSQASVEHTPGKQRPDASSNGTP